ncbi:spore maturation protein [Tepidibacillus infernus]|uniref:Spore maturation protein n=1 Tax=Tepidibacillus decaturensis TaxID=1413211 RepID=A0A135L3B0_9BACI|nr:MULTISPECIES: spore maturation protein [Tepidibacillus]KXG43359.1 spore maturation protein [Tepidibacillus decaturensis]GBF11575.1 spore maturation protein B [Tepidibacillus sp. HK-1]
MTQWITTISLWIIPGLISIILLFAIWNRVPVFETFVDGAKNGFQTAINIMPHLVGMMVAITVFRESGALQLVIDFIHPFLTMFHFPTEVFPLAMMRPITGTGALAITTDLIATHGPDSFIGRLASTMQGSSDTTLYIITVYFGAVGIKKAGYALKVGLFADLIAVIASLMIVSYYF